MNFNSWQSLCYFMLFYLFQIHVSAFFDKIIIRCNQNGLNHCTYGTFRSTILFAKNKKLSTSSKTGVKGFQKPAPLVTIKDETNADSVPQDTIEEENKLVTKKNSMTADDVFRKYKVTDEGDTSNPNSNSKSKNDTPAFGEAVLGRFSPKLLQSIDRILITSTFISLLYCILCGIGISVGAFKVVFLTITLPPETESLITNVLSPSFTPSLIIFLFFSVTFGVYKFAQVSSNQTVYRE